MIGQVVEKMELLEWQGELEEVAGEKILQEKAGRLVAENKDRAGGAGGGGGRSGVSTAARRKFHHTTCRTWFERAT